MYEGEALPERIVVEVFFAVMFIVGIVMLPYYLAGVVKRKAVCIMRRFCLGRDK